MGRSRFVEYRRCGKSAPNGCQCCSAHVQPSTGATDSTAVGLRSFLIQQSLHPNTAKPLAAAYDEYLTGVRVRQAKVCTILCLILVPACSLMDKIVYPQIFWPSLWARLIHDLVMAPYLALLYTDFAKRHIRNLDDLWAVPATAAICWMIYATEGVLTPYYAGLCLVVIGGCLIIPFTTGEAIPFCLFVLSMYGLACVAHSFHPPTHGVPITHRGVFSTAISNLYFLTLTCVICATACHYSAMRRFTEFRLRYELDVNNTELASTVKKLKETEVQLVQSEKLNALGKLSAGLLHEINNPLNFTFMALQVAEQDAGDNANLKETLADIGQGMSRIRSVVGDLRAFAYPSKSTEQLEFELDDALTTAMRLTTHELADIAIDHAQLVGKKPLGAKTQLVHVFMNLLVNAAHATRKQSLRKPAIVVGCTERNGKLHVRVRDNGTGIKAADKAKIFEPFFTTKPAGEGMGLGLSICQTIVQNHGSTLQVDSLEGEWTELSFDLPLAQPQRMAA